jgi:formate-dependent nitrite reductase cytochrome c552 subunit
MRGVLLLAAILLAACRQPESYSHGGLLSTLEKAGEVEGTPAMQVEPRTAQLTRFPCAKCHDKPLSALKQTKPAAHWEIKLQHAPGILTECKTCHSEAAMETLVLMNGKTADLNSSHELCAQCHSRQAADWRGGAHGKRTSGWAEERRVLSCAGCHNPHQPRLAPRFPSLSRKHSEKTP